MDTKEWLMAAGTAVSLGSAVVAVFALVMNRKVAMGQAETSLRTSIRVTRQSVRDLTIQISSLLDGRRDDQLRAEDRRRLQPLANAFKDAVEENLNAYEDACAKYLDRKIDRKRFQKMYITEIRNLIECDSENVMHEMLHPEGTSRFRAIWKVYHRWHNLEK